MSFRAPAGRPFARALLFAAALAGVVAAPPAQAQDSNAAFWLQERERQMHVRPAPRQPAQIRRLVPNKRLAKPTIWRAPAEPHLPRPPGLDPSAPKLDPTAPPEAAPVDPPQQPATAPATPEPQTADVAPARPPEAAAAPPVAAAPKATIAVVGDNLGFMLAQGLADAQAEGGQLAVVRKTRDSSGLVRDDFYDWQKNLRDILAGPDKYAAIAIMIGSNDRQELRDAAGRHEPLSPAWREIYTARVAALLAQLKDKRVPFYWIGLPVMKADRYSADMAQLNEIYRAQTEAAGGKFVATWDAFADEAGRYSAFGPNVNGEIVKLRTGDGVHFTKAGARKLAYFAEQSMRTLIEPQKPAPEAPMAALPPAPREQAAPAPAAAPKAETPAPPPKPIAGPILPLTAPPVAPGGELAGPLDRRAQQARAGLPQEAPPPRPGRADDFSWPRR